MDISVAKTSEIPSKPAVLIGGPMAGRKVSVPVFPDGQIPERAELPYLEPHESSLRAVYELRGYHPAHARWAYFFVEVLPPEPVLLEAVDQLPRVDWESAPEPVHALASQGRA